MTKAVDCLGAFETAAATMRPYVERLGLNQGDVVTAVVSANDVLIDK